MSEQSSTSETQLANGAGTEIAARADLPRRIEFFGPLAVMVGVMVGRADLSHLGALWARASV